MVVRRFPIEESNPPHKAAATSLLAGRIGASSVRLDRWPVRPDRIPPPESSTRPGPLDHGSHQSRSSFSPSTTRTPTFRGAVVMAHGTAARVELGRSSDLRLRRL